MTSDRQDYDDSNVWDRPVQCFRYRTNGPKNETESARTLCRLLGWRFDSEDRVTLDHGDVIALTIEDAAAAMIDAGWIIRAGSGGGWVTNFNPLPRGAEASFDQQAAVQILSKYLQGGAHNAWRSAALKR